MNSRRIQVSSALNQQAKNVDVVFNMGSFVQRRELEFVAASDICATVQEKPNKIHVS